MAGVRPDLCWSTGRRKWRAEQEGGPHLKGKVCTCLRTCNTWCSHTTQNIKTYGRRAPGLARCLPECPKAAFGEGCRDGGQYNDGILIKWVHTVKELAILSTFYKCCWCLYVMGVETIHISCMEKGMEFCAHRYRFTIEAKAIWLLLKRYGSVFSCFSCVQADKDVGCHSTLRLTRFHFSFCCLLAWKIRQVTETIFSSTAIVVVCVFGWVKCHRYGMHNTNYIKKHLGKID